MMNLFGKKKTPTSTVSASSATQPSDPQKTIVKLRETISNQEKRWVNSVLVQAISVFQSESRRSDFSSTTMFHENGLARLSFMITSNPITFFYF